MRGNELTVDMALMKAKLKASEVVKADTAALTAAASLSALLGEEDSKTYSQLLDRIKGMTGPSSI